MKFIYDDGGRSKWYDSTAPGDCVARAISIATEKDYLRVYSELTILLKASKQTKSIRGKTPRTGIPMGIMKKYLLSLGWKWIPTMGIGTGCKVHMKSEELPSGRIIARVSKHVVAIIDGVIHDIFDCSRNETRCVYGYFLKKLYVEK